MRLLTIPLFLVSVLISACGGDATGSGSSLTGTYEMESINGDPLPVEIILVEIRSSTLTFRSNGTFSGQATMRDLETGAVTTEQGNGTYTRSGNTIRMLEDGENEASEATLNGRTLTVNAGFLVVVYRRR